MTPHCSLRADFDVTVLDRLEVKRRPCIAERLGGTWKSKARIAPQVGRIARTLAIVHYYQAKFGTGQEPRVGGVIDESTDACHVADDLKARDHAVSLPDKLAGRIKKYALLELAGDRPIFVANRAQRVLE